MTSPRTLAFVVALAVALTACDAAGPDLGDATADAAAAPGGPATHLTFSSQKAFADAYDALLGLPVDQASTSKSSGAFVSMKAAETADAKAVDQGQKSPSQVRMGVVEDAYFASLLSPGGVVRIGDTVYKVGLTTVFVGGPSDAAAFESRTEAELTAAGTYESKPVERTGGSPWYGASDSRCVVFVSGPSTYRTCGMTYSTGWLFFRSAGAQTNQFKRGWFGIYYPISSGELSMTSTYRMGPVGLPLPAARTRTTDGTGTIAHVFFRSIGPRVYGWASTTHRGTVATESVTFTTTISIP